LWRAGATRVAETRIVLLARGATLRAARGPRRVGRTRSRAIARAGVRAVAGRGVALRAAALRIGAAHRDGRALPDIARDLAALAEARRPVRASAVAADALRAEVGLTLGRRPAGCPGGLFAAGDALARGGREAHQVRQADDPADAGDAGVRRAVRRRGRHALARPVALRGGDRCPARRAARVFAGGGRVPIGARPRFAKASGTAGSRGGHLTFALRVGAAVHRRAGAHLARQVAGVAGPGAGRVAADALRAMPGAAFAVGPALGARRLQAARMLGDITHVGCDAGGAVAADRRALGAVAGVGRAALRRAGHTLVRGVALRGFRVRAVLAGLGRTGGPGGVLLARPASVAAAVEVTAARPVVVAHLPGIDLTGSHAGAGALAWARHVAAPACALAGVVAADPVDAEVGFAVARERARATILLLAAGALAVRPEGALVVRGALIVARAADGAPAVLAQERRALLDTLSSAGAVSVAERLRGQRGRRAARRLANCGGGPLRTAPEGVATAGVATGGRILPVALRIEGVRREQATVPRVADLVARQTRRVAGRVATDLVDAEAARALGAAFAGVTEGFETAASVLALLPGGAIRVALAARETGVGAGIAGKAGAGNDRAQDGLAVAVADVAAADGVAVALARRRHCFCRVLLAATFAVAEAVLAARGRALLLAAGLAVGLAGGDERARPARARQVACHAALAAPLVAADAVGAEAALAVEAARARLAQRLRARGAVRFRRASGGTAILRSVDRAVGGGVAGAGILVLGARAAVTPPGQRRDEEEERSTQGHQAML